MKILKSALIIVSFFLINSISAQELNWRSISSDTKHLISLHFGADYSSYYGISYGYIFKAGNTPIAAGSELTLPFGNDLLDDWKYKMNVQAEIWHNEKFSLAIKPALIVRRYESGMARIYNIASDLTLTFGYMKPTWSIVAVTNYDHSFMNHIENDLLKTYYTGIRNGWYGASGGNFKFGIRANGSYKSWNGYLSIGKAYSQNFNDNPTLPFFAEISIQHLIIRTHQK